MLCLTRRDQERLVISVGDVRITVMVIELGGGKVRLGIDAPRSVQIAREELLPVSERPPMPNGGLK